VVLADISLLQQQAALAILQLDGHGTMELAVAMSSKLGRSPKRPITFVDQNHLVVLDHRCHPWACPAVPDISFLARNRPSHSEKAVVAAQMR
jgi:hypothetical protein